VRKHLTEIRPWWTGLSLWQRRLILSAVLFLDAYLGVNFNAGVIAWSGLFSGDLKWMILAIEMMASGLIAINAFLVVTRERWRTASLLATPFLIVIFGFVVLEFLLTGVNRSATINFNLASVSLSGLYWSAAYLSVAVGLTLTYKVQRYANFAQVELLLVGAYVALLVMWSDRLFSVSDAPKDGSLEWLPHR
jgi:hypothetical protein